MYRQTEKAKAMMAAKLIADIDAAQTLGNDLLRAATEATAQLQYWVDMSEGTPEVYAATSVALRRLNHIAVNARSIDCDPIGEDVAAAFQEAILALRFSIRRKQTPPQNSDIDGPGSLDDEDFGTQLTESGVPLHHMPKDVELSVRKACVHRYILLFALFGVVLIGTVIIVLSLKSRYLQDVDEIERNVTIELGLLALEALDTFYNSSIDLQSTSGQTLAVQILEEMTANHADDVTFQEIYTRSTNYLTEFRAAVQDFTRKNAVTAMLTSRQFGGICEKNETILIRRENDVLANQSFVIPVLTPNLCADDGSSNGIFANLVPSFVRYQDFVQTYRRSPARCTTFYHYGFSLSVAVTRDRVTLQQFITPEDTLVGRLEQFFTVEENWNRWIAIWCGLTLALSVLLFYGLLLWMFSSTSPRWRCWFPIGFGMVMAVALTTVFLIAQSFLFDAYSSATLLATTAMVATSAGALASENMINYGASNTFARNLVNKVFPGRFFLTDVLATQIIPSSMQGVADAIDARTVSIFRRGQYAEEIHGYAVSSSYVDSISWNLIIAQKLPPRFSLHWSIAVVLTCGILAFIVVWLYMKYSPLARLQKYGLSSPIFRYQFHGSTLRYLFYSAVVVCNIASMVGWNVIGVTEAQKHMRELAESTLLFTSAYVRGPQVVDLCTNGCGIPDFATMLYFKLTQDASSEYPSIEYLQYDLPLPFPLQDEWESRYIGAELATNNLHTLLVNAPSFSTPIVNRSTNVTDPRFLVRNMVSATGINSTVGFTIERFPDSFYPFSYSFASHSIGVCIMVTLAAVIIPVCEWQYLRLHEKFKKGISLRSPLLVMGGMLGLILAGFFLHGLVMKAILINEFREFAYKELSFTAYVMGYRLGLISLSFNATRTELISLLIEAASSSSDSCMLFSPNFGRVRLAYEYPERGSGTVRVAGVPKEDSTISIGSLDRGYVPVCGDISGQWVSHYVDKEMTYCYVEIPQSAENIDVTPRLFLLSFVDRGTWIDQPAKSVWTNFFSAGVLIGVAVTLVLFYVLYYAIHDAQFSGFALVKERDCISFAEPLPLKFSRENFIPLHQRYLWIISFLVLGVVLVYYSCALGDAFYMLRQSHDVSVASVSQSQLIANAISDALCNAYNFIMFPYPPTTSERLLDMADEAAAGQLSYIFITPEGLQYFQNAVAKIYDNLTKTNGINNAILMAANKGWGSYSSYIAAYYETTYITNQASVFTKINNILAKVSTDVTNGIVTDYASAIDCLYQAMILRDLVRKLFILDHIAISSYADFAEKEADNWPWPGNPDEATLIDVTKKAAKNLKDQVDAALVSLKSVILKASPSSKDSVSYSIDSLTTYYSTVYALSSLSGNIWDIQSARGDEALSVSNYTRMQIAQNQQEMELAEISSQSDLFDDSLNSELTARKTNQLVDYIRDGMPLEDQLPSLAWQRFDTFKVVERMYGVVFACTMIGYIAVAASMLFQFQLIRRRTVLVQENLRDQDGVQGKKMKENDEHHSDKIVKSRDDDGKYSSKDLVLEDSLTPSSTGLMKKSGGVEKSVTDEPAAPQRQAPVRSQRYVLLSVFGFLLVTLVPMVCSFWIISLAHSSATNWLTDVAVILSLYSRVSSFIDTAESVLDITVQYYTGVITIETVNDFFTSFAEEMLQIVGCYKWDMNTNSNAATTAVQTAFDLVYTSALSEIKSFQSVLPATDIPNYPTPQSNYARVFLPTLTDANKYGALLEMGATSGGSVETFATDAYNDAKTAVTGASLAVFTNTFLSYSLQVNGISQISDCQLQMWHATVAGARTKGAPAAVKYSTFSSLVSGTALSGISASTVASKTQALADVAAYYKELLDKAGTSEQVYLLFTTTEDAPTTFLVPDSAYFAAGWVTSTFYHIVTETKFANIFAYNRNLTTSSADLGDVPTLSDSVTALTNSVMELLFSIGQPNTTQVAPAVINKWVWSTEVTVRQNAAHDHSDIQYLSDALRWCCIASFWALLVSMVMAAHIVLNF